MRLLALGLGLAAGTLTALGQGAPTKRPNILLFLVDDLGWQDTSVPFYSARTPLNDRYHTPSEERLAEEGMRFTDAYACSISSPTRVSLMTGMNAARHRVTNWTLERDKTTDLESEMLDFPRWNVNGLSPVPGIPLTVYAKPLPQILHDAGYYTIHVGKAHLGAIGTPGESPLNLGFDVNIAGHAAGGPTSYLGEQNYGNRTDGEPSPLFAVPGLEKYWGTDTFLTEALTLEAVRALEERDQGKPFFLYMAHYGVHVPIDRDARYYEKYRARRLSEKEAAYAALIEGVDKSLGDLMRWLDERGLMDDTIILFMSDNGGFATDTYWRDAPLYVQNAPLRSGKGSAYEGGVRVPLIVRWPGVTEEGSTCHDYVIAEDLFPTLLEMARVRDVSLPQAVDGRSFVPLLSDPEWEINKPERSLCWNYPNLWGNTGPGIAPTCSIRRGDWKMVYYYEDGRHELFDLRHDIGEETDLAAQHPDIVRSLSSRLGDHLRSVGGQRPTLKDGTPCPWPDEALE